MSIFLTILKIIGILLLVILGLVLFVVLTVLFVPIRYRADGDYHETITADANVSWLFHLFSAKLSYAENLNFEIKIAGIRIFPRAKKKKEKKHNRSRTEEEGRALLSNETEPAKSSQETKQPPKDCPITEKGPDTAPDRETAKASQKEESAAARPETEPISKAETLAEDEKKKEKVPLSEKLHQFFRKWKSKLSALCDKIKNIKDKADYYKSILQKEEVKRAAALGFQQLGRILKHVLPRRMNVRFIIGTGDPASTGQIMAMQGILYPWLKDKICIIPDFEEKRVEGTFHFKGRIRLIRLVICGLRIAFSKDVRFLIRLFLKKEEA